MESLEIRPDRGVVRMNGPSADAYLDILSCCVDAARLNDLYPPGGHLLAALDGMSSNAHQGLYPSLDVHIRSGLPAYREFVRVLSDQQTAAQELDKLQCWAGVRGEAIYDKLDKKRAYLSQLVEGEAVFRENTRINFRKIDPETEMAKFRIVLDRFVTSGLIERLTVELSQRDSLWGKTDLARDDNHVVRISEDLKGMVYRFSTQEVEMIFVRLSGTPSIEVDSVIKGSLGPFLYEGIEPPDGYAPLCTEVGRGGVLNAALQIASVEQGEDLNNDPFSKGVRLSPEAREQYYAVCGTRPYHVLKDRKFALCDVDRERVREILAGFDTNNIIYEV